MKNERYVMKISFFLSMNMMQLRFEYILICVLKNQIISYASVCTCSIVVE